jgi:hypothetical protein
MGAPGPQQTALWIALWITCAQPPDSLWITCGRGVELVIAPLFTTVASWAATIHRLWTKTPRSPRAVRRAAGVNQTADDTAAPTRHTVDVENPQDTDDAQHHPRDGARRVDGTGERAYAPTLLATAAWFVGPAVLYALWTLLFAQDTCAGEPCGRLDRIGTGISAALPWAFPSLALSLLVAVLLRLPAVGWRAGATGTAAAILGCGLTTVILRSFGYEIG